MMNPAKYIGLTILAIVWLWLSWSILSTSGINIKNLLLVAMSGIIIFVPLYKKYFAKKEDK